MNESALTAQIKRALEAEGCIVLKYHGSEVSRAGIPDLIGVVGSPPESRRLLDGYFFGIEVKKPDGSHPVSKLQAHWLRKLAAKDALVGVARSVDEALAIVRGEGSGEFV